MNFKHSGDLGDIIFSLPAIKALGGGTLYLSQCEKGFTREQMTRERAGFIMPLLGRQSCIRKVEVYRGQSVIYDLDEFRRLWQRMEAKEDIQGSTIAEWHCRAFDVDLKVIEEPWLECERQYAAPVVINRTLRYHGRKFPWAEVVKRYGHDAIFVGLEEEHEQFVGEFGFVRYRPVRDGLEMARVINGCSLFIGNQSFAEACAEGLKKPKILEVPTTGQFTSLYPRSDAQYVHHGKMWFPGL